MSYLFHREQALDEAQRIIQAIHPHCERAEIVGSLRRGKKVVKDIDIVAVPKMTSTTMLFGRAVEVAETNFYAALREALKEVTAEGTSLIRGVADNDRGAGAKLMCDVYIATEESWALLKLVRTGSAEHNIWMCGRAKQIGGALHADGSGIELPGQYDPVKQCTIDRRVLRPENEAEVFTALGLPFADPHKREIWNGKPAWMGSAREPGEEG